ASSDRAALRAHAPSRFEIEIAAVQYHPVCGFGVRRGNLAEPDIAQHELGIPLERIAAPAAAGRAHPQCLAGSERPAGNRGPSRLADGARRAGDLECTGYAVAAAGEPSGRFALIAAPAADREIAMESADLADHGEAPAVQARTARVRHERVAL